MAKPVVGLTGGIACGKSAVARLFEELGVPVIDADQLAREVVAPGTPGLERIVEEFGQDVLSRDGTLDRKKLADVVFEDEEARQKLNSIMHPLIATAGADRIAALQSHPGAFILYEAALLVETGSYQMFNALIVVSASQELQLARLLARDGITKQEAAARIATQFPLEEKEAVADYVIRNDGTLEATRLQVVEVYDQLVADLDKE